MNLKQIDKHYLEGKILVKDQFQVEIQSNQNEIKVFKVLNGLNCI